MDRRGGPEFEAVRRRDHGLRATLTFDPVEADRLGLGDEDPAAKIQGVAGDPPPAMVPADERGGARRPPRPI